MKTETETASNATTEHKYKYPNLYQKIDPSGARTDYYYRGYNGPNDTSDHYNIIAYNAAGLQLQQTQLYKDIHSQISLIRQTGKLPNGTSKFSSHYLYYDEYQRLCREYTNEGRATLYQRDDMGQVTAYIKGWGNAGCGTVPNATGKVSLVYDQLGRITHTNYVAANTPDIHRTYDAVGNLKTLSRGTTNWVYNYNSLNLLDDETLTVDGRRYALAYDYDGSGYLTEKTLPSGRVVDYTLDGLGRIESMASNSTSLMTGASYHANGTVHRFSYGNDQSFTQTLNSRLLPHRLLAQNSNVIAIDQTYDYNSRGLITSIKDSAVTDNDRSYTYDGLGRLKTADGPWGEGQFEYDGLGNLHSKVLGERIVDIDYDHNLNRVKASYDPGKTGTRNFSYDNRGNITAIKTVSDDCMKTVTLNYSGTGATAWVHTARVNSCEGEVISLNSRSENKDLSPESDTFIFSEKILSGQTKTLSKTVRSKSDDAALEVFVEAKISSGRLYIRHRVKGPDGSYSSWRPHGYIDVASSENCLETKQLNYGGRGKTLWVHQASVNKCTGKVLSLKSTAENSLLSPERDVFDFGAVNGWYNQMTRPVTVKSNGAKLDVTVMVYSQNNRMWIYHKVKRPDGSYTQDLYHGSIHFPQEQSSDDGSLVGDLTFTYDYADQPIKVRGKTNSTYVYDGNMKRVKSVVDGKVIYNVYDASGALVHIHALSDAKITDYINGPMGSLARITNNDITYLHADHLGSAQSGTDSTGQLVWRERYTPYGEEIVGPAANDNLAGFTGHIKDKATGLNYMQARYYDPVIGRFLSIDPVTVMDTGNPAMFNRYAYVENDPINMIDRFGLCGTRAESYQDCTIEVDPGQDSNGNDNTLTDDQQSGVDNLTKAIRATGQAIADNGTDDEVAAWESISKFGINPNEDRGTTEATALGVNTPSEGVQVWKAGVDAASQNQNDASHIVIHETGHFRQSDIDRRQGIQNRGGGGLQFYNQEVRNDIWSVKSGKRLGTLPQDYKRRVYPIGGYNGP